MAPEEWRAIPGYPGYRVSSAGCVVGPRGPLPGSVLRGYRRVKLRRAGKPRSFRVNRLVLLAFVGPPPSALHHAAHGDGDSLNNTLDNLRWATPRENSDDKDMHGTLLRHGAHPSSKLTDEQAEAIRGTLARHMEERTRAGFVRPRRGLLAEIAASHGVSVAAIKDIHHGRSWRHPLYLPADPRLRPFPPRVIGA